MKDPVREVQVTRKFNLGNYQSMDISMIATVKEGDNAEDVIEQVDDRILKVAAIRRKVPM